MNWFNQHTVRKLGHSITAKLGTGPLLKRRYQSHCIIHSLKEQAPPFRGILFFLLLLEGHFRTFLLQIHPVEIIICSQLSSLWPPHTSMSSFNMRNLSEIRNSRILQVLVKQVFAIQPNLSVEQKQHIKTCKSNFSNSSHWDITHWLQCKMQL